MSNSIRFEFYNNFDIWYDLYQENGGDPSSFIFSMICGNRSEQTIIHRYSRRVKKDAIGNGSYLKIGYGSGITFGDGCDDVKKTCGNGRSFFYGVTYGKGCVSFNSNQKGDGI